MGDRYPARRLDASGRPRHTVNGLAARLALLEARVDGLASKDDVRAILENLLSTQRRHRWQLAALIVPVALASLASILEIARVLTLGHL